MATNYTSNAFVVSAGCLLVRLVDGVDLQLCILYNTTRGKWVLPKGRKDCGESIEAAALRETFEETGYSCEFLPCTMETRAPLPGVDLHPSKVLTVEHAIEPFAVTQQTKNGAMKFIWWFIARPTSSKKVLGTQTTSEAYDSHFVSIDDAVGRLSDQQDREIAAKARQIIGDTAGQGEGLAALFQDNNDMLDVRG
ncbi:hypothetical protein PC9H_000945 [Pleurotus ostreatus]|uniref:Nudix hydrolase domain-containing protein n=1 Tax=Pleurotus ostreatus TaxID=5322 RepID=A0A8H7DVR7_PLEOS|nr:uncharacterized protein PC9H_000945 [Pleurotus ostreatus]KAF7440599.1 hypothetical protein PC9H_000945 [Pleurotus ostreatus]KAJ8700029.1 hypothetical protein PTI98_003096 [Pleurotus ostreatus]